MAAGRDEDPTNVTAGNTVRESACWPEMPFESVAMTVNVVAPEDPGAPLSTPAGLRDIPDGSVLPGASANWYPVPDPPLAASVWVYGTFTTAADSVVGLMLTGALTVSSKPSDDVWLVAVSVALTIR